MRHPTSDVGSAEESEQKEARSVAEILQESQELYDDKNDDYGDSWRLVGKTLKLWLDHLGEEKLVLENEHELNSVGLFTRRLDKMIRAFNAWFCADELKVNESVVETQEDQIPYAAMHTQLAEEYVAMDYSDFSGEDTR